MVISKNFCKIQTKSKNCPYSTPVHMYIPIPPDIFSLDVFNKKNPKFTDDFTICFHLKGTEWLFFSPTPSLCP